MAEGLRTFIPVPERHVSFTRVETSAGSVPAGAKSGGPEDAVPILSYVVEHDDGHIVIDTGADHATAESWNSSWGAWPR